jgi:hypothetical protein
MNVHEILRVIIAVAAVVIFVWLLLGRKGRFGQDAVIDPNDPRQIGTLIGLTGGSVADAAVAQFALRRFEKERGRKATVRDMAIVAGMMRGMR